MLANCTASYVSPFPWWLCSVLPAATRRPPVPTLPPHLAQRGRGGYWGGSGGGRCPDVGPGDPVNYSGDLRFALTWKLTVTLMSPWNCTYFNKPFLLGL